MTTSNNEIAAIDLTVQTVNGQPETLKAYRERTGVSGSVARANVRAAWVNESKANATMCGMEATAAAERGHKVIRKIAKSGDTVYTIKREAMKEASAAGVKAARILELEAKVAELTAKLA